MKKIKIVILVLLSLLLIEVLSYIFYGKSDENTYYATYRIGEDKWGLSYQINHELPIYVVVLEQNGTLYYGEEWETHFIWCFWKWIKIKRRCIGQS